MSIKSITLICGLFLIFSSYSSTVADSSIEEEIEAAESTRVMAPLLDLDHAKLPLLTEAKPTLSEKFSDRVTQTRVQKILDQDMLAPMSLLKASNLVDDYNTLQFAN